MSQQGRALPAAGRTPLSTQAQRAFVVLVLLGLAGLAGWLQAERNRSAYFLVAQPEGLIVERGLYFLWGTTRWAPEDPDDAAAYAPIVPPPGAAPAPLVRFTEREQLDRYLFELLSGWAETRIRAGSAEHLSQGVLFLERAAKLHGVTRAQAGRLEELRAEIAFHDARDKLEQAGKALAKASEQLQRAADAGGPRALDARALLPAVEGSAKLLDGAVRAARAATAGVPVLPAVPVPVPEVLPAPVEQAPPSEVVAPAEAAAPAGK